MFGRYVSSGKCLVGEMSGQGNVCLGKCLVGEVSGRGSVWSGKCPVGEVFGWGNVWSGKCLLEMCPRGNVQSGKCPFTVFLILLTLFQCIFYLLWRSKHWVMFVVQKQLLNVILWIISKESAIENNFCKMTDQIAYYS